MAALRGETVTRATQVSHKMIRASASAEVRTFCESVSEASNKSITLLRAVDQTVDWLKLLKDRATADAAFARRMLDVVRTCEPSKRFDADGTLCSQLFDAEESLKRLHGLLVSKRLAGINADELRGADKETVVDTYTEAIACIGDIHNSLSALRWAIGEHDADLEPLPTNQAISSLQELEVFFKTL